MHTGQYKKKSLQLNNHFRVTFYGDVFTNVFSHLTIQNTVSSYIVNAEKPDDWESSIVNKLKHQLDSVNL